MGRADGWAGSLTGLGIDLGQFRLLVSVGFMMSRQEFADAGLAISREANVMDKMHAYFVQHAERLYKTSRRFHLLDRKLGDVLEIGPFYGYLPFLLQPNASSYTILEGDDTVAYALKPLYEKRGIAAHYVDLFEMFGPIHSATHTLPFAEGSFDTLICWGTMEHFNFNPAKFVRQLHRVLKPGGKVYIQVPNRVSLQNLVIMLFGREEHRSIDYYYDWEDYVSNGKKAFYGFHWREYSPGELEHLFAKAAFQIRSCKTFVSFQILGRASLARSMARFATRMVGTLIPRYAGDVDLVAEK